MLKVLLFCIPVLCAGISSWAQPGNADALQKKQAAIQQEIATLRQSLQGIRHNKKASLNELAIVKRKLQLREQAIETIQQQINLVRSSVHKSTTEIGRLTSELDILKLQYQKSVVYAYKSQSNYDFLNFVFSAANFADALKRVEYLRSYRAYREQQVLAIQNTRVLLHQKIGALQRTRQQQSHMLKLQQKERLVFVEEKKEKDEVVNKLKSREKELVKELAAKAKADKKLSEGIHAAIRREKEKERVAAAAIKKGKPTAVKKTEKATPVKPERAKETSAETIALSAEFAGNRGKLPWPVEQGIITMHFGLQKEGAIIYNNPGLTIETEKNAPVKAVFDGVVISVFDIEGNANVFVKHGNYYTTYGNLATAQVANGDVVKAGQVVGRAAINREGNGVIEFVILKDNMKVDPEQWIRKR
jgi:septal ring factor EnvC (AmiA/AmiB activator)